MAIPTECKNHPGSIMLSKETRKVYKAGTMTAFKVTVKFECGCEMTEREGADE